MEIKAFSILKINDKGKMSILTYVNKEVRGPEMIKQTISAHISPF